MGSSTGPVLTEVVVLPGDPTLETGAISGKPSSLTEGRPASPTCEVAQRGDSGAGLCRGGLQRQRAQERRPRGRHVPKPPKTITELQAMPRRSRAAVPRPCHRPAQRPCRARPPSTRGHIGARPSTCGGATRSRRPNRSAACRQSPPSRASLATSRRSRASGERLALLDAMRGDLHLALERRRGSDRARRHEYKPPAHP